MLEKPNLPDEKIIACLRDEYGLRVAQFAFLPLGVDANAAVYRAIAHDSKPYFVKLRRGIFHETSVALPKLFSDQGIRRVIPPFATRSGKLWASLGEYKLILYPFVQGRDGYAVTLADQNWRELGTILKRIQSAVVPRAVAIQIPREVYSSRWRESARSLMDRIARDGFDDPVSAELAAFLRPQRRVVLDLVERADRFARELVVRPRKFVLCHSDLHAGNVLVDASGSFYIVDWDDALFAPKERDLMFAGGGLMGGWRTPDEEETLFYQGYGFTQIDPVALSYYRYERVVQDIAAFCEDILQTRQGQDREQSLRYRAQSLHYLKSNFLPNNTIDIAYRSDKMRNAA